MPKAPTRVHANDEKLFRHLRAAWKKGENPTRMKVDGKEWEFEIRSVTKKVSYTLGVGGGKYVGSPQVLHREETWLVARATDRVGPVFNVEPTPGCNSRVTAALL